MEKWHNKISYEKILQLIDFWIDNYPNKLREIPQELKSHISKEDVEILQRPYRINGKISAEGLDELRKKIDSKIKEIRKEEKYDKWQKKQIFWFRMSIIFTIILVIATIIFTSWSALNSSKTLEIQRASMPSVNPDIYVYLTNDYYFSSWDLASIVRYSNGEFKPQEGILYFKVVNNGQRPTGYMNFYLLDEDKEYMDNVEEQPSLTGLSHDFFQISFWHSNCSLWGDNYDTVYDRCKETEENLNNGIKDFILLIDCPGCVFKDEIKCYDLKICIYDDLSSEEDCRNKWRKEFSNLKEMEIDCPLNWRFLV